MRGVFCGSCSAAFCFVSRECVCLRRLDGWISQPDKALTCYCTSRRRSRLYLDRGRRATPFAFVHLKRPRSATGRPPRTELGGRTSHVPSATRRRLRLILKVGPSQMFFNILPDTYCTNPGYYLSHAVADGTMLHTSDVPLVHSR